MKTTWEERADLKQALKHDPTTPALWREASRFPLEADEACEEVLAGHATCAPDSWVAATT